MPSLALSSSPPSSAELPGRFAACAPYEAAAENAVALYWPARFQYPRAWLSQVYQESLCDSAAVSPVGARGLAQFMGGTWADMERYFGMDANPHSDLAIEWGALYQARMMAVWSGRPRPMTERWRLGLASYNAGAGNIIAAQAECDGARDWAQIETCLQRITGRHAAETRTYVARIERWTCALARSPLDRPAGLDCTHERTGP